MVFFVLTVAFYTMSSLGDKFISKKLNCSAREFAFLVSASTALFLAVLLPFVGWRFPFTAKTVIALLVLIGCKNLEFYTSAVLLKTVSAYELKAWLSLNVIVSFLVDLARGSESFFAAFVPCSIVLVIGIVLVAVENNEGKMGRYVLWSLLYIASKFLYGLQMNVLPKSTSPVCTLMIVMVCVALLQLPFIRANTFLQKKGLWTGVLTRIPNTAGLWTEVIAAQQSLLLYSLVQPAQFAILFLVAWIRREKLGNVKFAGSIAALVSATVLTLLIYWNRGAI